MTDDIMTLCHSVLFTHSNWIQSSSNACCTSRSGVYNSPVR